MKTKIFRPCGDAERVILSTVAAAGEHGASPEAIHQALEQAFITSWPDITSGMIAWLREQGTLTGGEQDRLVLSR